MATLRVGVSRCIVTIVTTLVYSLNQETNYQAIDKEKLAKMQFFKGE